MVFGVPSKSGKETRNFELEGREHDVMLMDKANSVSKLLHVSSLPVPGTHS